MRSISQVVGARRDAGDKNFPVRGNQSERAGVQALQLDAEPWASGGACLGRAEPSRPDSSA